MSLASFAALRAGWLAARDVIAEAGGRHQHAEGQECPVCKASDNVVDIVEDVVTSLAPPDETHRVTFACWRCRDTGWVELNPAEHPDLGEGVLVHPCPNCAPATYERWADGHYEPKHFGCSECEDVRRGRTR